MFTSFISYFSNFKNSILISSILYIIYENKKINKKSLLNMLSPIDDIDQELSFLKDLGLIKISSKFDISIIEKNLNLFKEKDISSSIPSKKNLNKNQKDKELDQKVELIINNLKMFSGKKLRFSVSHKKYISKRLNEGFTLNDFFLVNKYYSTEWNNPKMRRYIVPSTLYNEKFGDRVSVAEEFFESHKKNKEAINLFIKEFSEYYKEVMGVEYTLLKDDYRSILYWINEKDISVISNVAFCILDKWGKQPKYKHLINLSYIFNGNFEEREAKFKNGYCEGSGGISNLYNLLEWGKNND